MKRDPMAGSWIVEGVIALLIMLLVGKIFGLSANGWWGVVSLLVGCAVGAVFREVRPPPNGQS